MTTIDLEPLDAAKAAIARKDWERARLLLAPLVRDRPRGLPGFLLARAELELGRPLVAAPLISAFRAARPQHVGACALAGRVYLAVGRLDDAEDAVKAGLEVEPDNKVFPQLLESIAAARGMAEASAHVEIIDNGYLRARREGPTPAMVKAAEALGSFAPGPDWMREPEQAKVAYFCNATDVHAALRNYDPNLIEVSVAFDYVAWPKRIQEYVRGRSVLDVGCGFGGFGVGFLIAGATSYAGLDPAMDLDSTRAKNKRVRKWDDMGVTPRQIQEALPAIRLFQSSSEDKSFDETFDTIALHNVTEHLMQLEEVFSGLVRLCKPETDVVFHHHNYYCWNGHHMPPNQPAQLDPDDAKQQMLYDWRHVWAKDELPESSYVFSNLNQVRLDELRTIVEKYFDIVRWDEIPSSKPTLDRLTPEIMDNVRGVIPDIEERELTVNAVLGVARPKASS